MSLGLPDRHLQGPNENEERCVTIRSSGAMSRELGRLLESKGAAAGADSDRGQALLHSECKQSSNSKLLHPAGGTAGAFILRKLTFRTQTECEHVQRASHRLLFDNN